jgi:hypothetical protein
VEPAEPEKDQAAPKPKRTRTSAGKKTPTRAKAKTAAPAKEKAGRAGSAKPKAKTTKTKAKKAAPAREEPLTADKRSRPSTKARTAAPAKRKATRTTTRPKTKPAEAAEQAAPQAQTSSTPEATNGTAEGEDMTGWPDLAAAVEALREDLRNARTPRPKKRNRPSTDADTTAPAKPKAARSSKKPKTQEGTKATEQAAAQGSPSPTSAAANGVTNIKELAQFRPDLAAAVEALQGDLRNARTATTKKGRRKSSARAR